MARTPGTQYVELIAAQDKRFKHKGYWAGPIGGPLEAGWRLKYTEGTGGNERPTAAVLSTVEWEGVGHTQGHKLGHISNK